MNRNYNNYYYYYIHLYRVVSHHLYLMPMITIIVVINFYNLPKLKLFFVFFSLNTHIYILLP